jgi:leucyl/phenylalanyl-tRNA---protein transferase
VPVYQLSNEINIFPDPDEAIDEGLLAVGGDLSIDRLLLAYSSGIFPWYSQNEPIMWWSPDPRFVLFPNDFKISKSLNKVVNSGKFIIKTDTAFEEVIKNCATIKRGHETGTWITTEMKQAYINLHNKGYAHSFEVYNNESLVGGLYGVSLGKAFFGESMFHLIPDASKVALYFLVDTLKKWKFHFIDSQIYTNHLASLGGEEIPRKKYLILLQKALKYETIKGKWEIPI